MRSSDQLSPWMRLWLAEAIYLHESHFGELADSDILRRIPKALSLEQRVIQRAVLLSEQRGLIDTAHKLLLQLRILGGVLLISMLLLGIFSAGWVLGDGTQTVNLFLSLSSFLGTHFVLLLIWISLLIFDLRRTSPLPIQTAWLSLLRLLYRRSDTVLLLQAATKIGQQQGILRWLAGLLSHLCWWCFFSGLVIALLFLLSGRRYDFAWETTLLPLSVFSNLTECLNSLPHWLGVINPMQPLAGEEIINPSLQRQLWGTWLLAVVLIYGWGIRSISVVVTSLIVKYRLRHATLPRFTPELSARLMIRRDIYVTDPAPSRAPHIYQSVHTINQQAWQTGSAWVGLEITAEQALPLSDTIYNLGVINNRTQRHRLLEQLTAQPIERLLIQVDAKQTPDRGSLSLIAELLQCSKASCVFLSYPEHELAPRLPLWRQQLLNLNINTLDITEQPKHAIDWLTFAHNKDEHA